MARWPAPLLASLLLLGGCTPSARPERPPTDLRFRAVVSAAPARWLLLRARGRLGEGLHPRAADPTGVRLGGPERSQLLLAFALPTRRLAERAWLRLTVQAGPGARPAALLVDVRGPARGGRGLGPVRVLGAARAMVERGQRQRVTLPLGEAARAARRRREALWLLLRSEDGAPLRVAGPAAVAPRERPRLWLQLAP